MYSGPAPGSAKRRMDPAWTLAPQPFPRPRSVKDSSFPILSHSPLQGPCSQRISLPVLVPELCGQLPPPDVALQHAVTALWAQRRGGGEAQASSALCAASSALRRGSWHRAASTHGSEPAQLTQDTQTRLKALPARVACDPEHVPRTPPVCADTAPAGSCAHPQTNSRRI